MLGTLKNKLFKKPRADKSGHGLYATIEELLEQKQYIAYLKNFHRKLSVANYLHSLVCMLKKKTEKYMSCLICQPVWCLVPERSSSLFQQLKSAP